jgi:hypothetical protein
MEIERDFERSCDKWFIPIGQMYGIRIAYSDGVPVIM